jgi:hypothetical protein
MIKRNRTDIAVKLKLIAQLYENLYEKFTDNIRNLQTLKYFLFHGFDTFLFRIEIEIRQDRRHETLKLQNHIDLRQVTFSLKISLDKILQPNVCKTYF